MRKIFFLLALCGITLTVQAHPRRLQKAAHNVSTNIVTAYTDSLKLLLDSIQRLEQPSAPSPYMFRLYAPGTVYSSALAQNMGTAVDPGDDAQLQLDAAINTRLNNAYVLFPVLFTGT